MRAHVIENGVVVNTILVKSLDFMPNLVDASLGGKRGDLWDGEFFTAPVDLDALKLAAWTTANNEKNRVRDGGFYVNGTLFDSDMTARIAYAELAIRLQVDPTFTTSWKASAGNWVMMTTILLNQVYIVGQKHIQDCFTWFALKEAEIQAATSVEELANISLVYE